MADERPPLTAGLKIEMEARRHASGRFEVYATLQDETFRVEGFRATVEAALDRMAAQVAKDLQAEVVTAVMAVLKDRAFVERVGAEILREFFWEVARERFAPKDPAGDDETGDRS